MLVTDVTVDTEPPAMDFFTKDGCYIQTYHLPPEHRIGTVKGKNIYTYISGTGQKIASITKWSVRDK